MAIESHKLYGLVLAALLLAVLAALPGSPAVAQGGQCGDPVTVTLWAGQHTASGTVTVWNDENYLYVQFQTTGGWTLTETHVHVATSLSGIPTNEQGIPVPGQFDYTATHNHISSYTYTIPLTWPEGTNLVIAAHATVALLDGDGEAVQIETAWGGDHREVAHGGGSTWSIPRKHARTKSRSPMAAAAPPATGEITPMIGTRLATNPPKPSGVCLVRHQAN